MTNSFLVNLFSVLASLVGILMSLSHFLQAWRIFKRKSADDVSFSFYGLMFGGSFIWLIYGILIHDIPLILSFFIAIFATGFVLLLMFKYRLLKKVH